MKIKTGLLTLATLLSLTSVAQASEKCEVYGYIRSVSEMHGFQAKKMATEIAFGKEYPNKVNDLQAAVKIGERLTAVAAFTNTKSDEAGCENNYIKYEKITPAQKVIVNKAIDQIDNAINN